MKKNKTTIFRFYEELNDFLPTARRKKSFSYAFSGKPTVKDAIEALGVPHPEIDLILVNGRSVNFGYHITDGDRISVYPEFESLDISPLIRLRPKPLRRSKFIADVQLGRLARYLRMLGFDTRYQPDFNHEQIITDSLNQKRIILTRDKGILKNHSVTRGYWLRNTDPWKQLKEILQRFDLYLQSNPFSRCMVCNGTLKPVNKQEVLELIPAKTVRYFDTFYQCPDCRRIYWPGSHYFKMQKKIEELMNK